MKKTLLFLILVLYVYVASSQNVIKGNGTNPHNQLLHGESVVEKVTNNGVFTDDNGCFTISYKNGLTGQEITVGKQKELNITLNINNVLGMVEVVGSRRQDRTAVESVVPVDIIEVSRLSTTLGQTDVNQMPQYLAPSFNSNKQSGADGADDIDPAILRGPGPDPL